ncbi:MAG TPA: hypothetical protein VMG12_08345 [Polyangiaceae bacterium]|nr:hypothetical protein [Polyangiaceae bacterium]
MRGPVPTFAAVALLAACQSPALVRTARTLPAGGNDLSLTVAVTRVSFPDVVVEGTRVPIEDFTLPSPIPDVLYAHGLSDDLELGGRLSLGSGLIEAQSKWRFIQAAQGTLHVALAPAVGYRVLALVNGPVLTLPLLVTYDLSPDVSLSAGALLSYASYSVPDSFRFDDDLDLSGQTLYAGGGLGIELRPAWGLHVMPAVELQRSVSRRGDATDLPAIDLLIFGVTFGWGSQRPDPARHEPETEVDIEVDVEPPPEALPVE